MSDFTPITPLNEAAAAAEAAPQAAPRPPVRPTARFMRAHPAHWMALGWGSGLSPVAPGTVGTLWAWLAFGVLNLWLAPLGPLAWGTVLVIGALVGVWACTVTARHMAVADPGAIVWDEVIAFWLVLWLIHPAGLWAQIVAFALFRYFDAAKPGPVGWADRWGKLRAGEAIGWRQGAGIMGDDLVAAGCTLMVIALWQRLWH